MSDDGKCSCNSGPALLFCCSGAADTAEIGDRAVRQLHKAGEAKMYCLAGIAGEAETIVNNTRAASRIVAVDGCDIDCARKTLEKAGFHGFFHLRTTDLGLEKGNSPVTEEAVGAVADRIRLTLSW